MTTDFLMMTSEDCVYTLTDALLKFVREKGDDCTDYEINQFGLEEEGVTKVYNFFDNVGCHFIEQDYVNDDTLEGMDEHNYYSKLYQAVTHTAYLCIYILQKNGKERLRYYRFYNGGVAFDDVDAEPEHGDVSSLPLLDIHYIIRAIRMNETGRA